MRMISAIMLFLLCTASVNAQPPAKVVVAKVTEEEVSKTNQLLGILEFDKRSGISPEIAGLIKKLSFSEGMKVKKGDVLASLNTDFIQKSIAIRTKEAEEVLIRIQNARKNLNRYEKLFKEAAASEKAYEDLADQLREYEKRHEIIQLNIEKLQIELKKFNIRAPFDGLILEKYKYEGEWISPGNAICLLGSTKDIVVNVAVAEDLVKYIIPGNYLYLRIHALDKEFKGHVRKLVPMADLATKTFQVKINIPYFESAIQNMSATVHVPVSHKMKLRMIKRDALIKHQGKDFVYTVKDGKATILPVNIVVFSGEYVGVDNPYVVSGMPVVIDGNDRLRPDQAVEIVEKG